MHSVSKTLQRAGFHRKTRGKKAATATSHAGKKAAATNGAGEVSKAERIRDVAKALGRRCDPVTWSLSWRKKASRFRPPKSA